MGCESTIGEHQPNVVGYESYHVVRWTTDMDDSHMPVPGFKLSADIKLTLTETIRQVVRSRRLILRSLRRVKI